MTYDSCNPVQKTAAFVRVTVVRNENRPVFAQAEYTVHVEETQPLGVAVASITATDRDVVRANANFSSEAVRLLSWRS